VSKLLFASRSLVTFATMCVRILSVLTAIVNQLASGLQPFLAGGVSIALQKPNRGVRPLCCGDPIRRLVGKCFCIGGKDEISKEFWSKNFGVGCPGGVEVVAHSLRNVLDGPAGPTDALLKIDFRNAFNMICSRHLREVSRFVSMDAVVLRST